MICFLSNRIVELNPFGPAPLILLESPNKNLFSLSLILNGKVFSLMKASFIDSWEFRGLKTIAVFSKFLDIEVKVIGLKYILGELDFSDSKLQLFS